MGLIQNGGWVDQWYDTDSTGGKFQRQDSAFRDHVGAKDHRYPVASGRYHLYVSLACPWAHRTLVFRVLKSLEAHISVSVVDPLMLEHGWAFNEGDPLYGKHYLYELYLKAAPSYEGRVTVPVLWDKKTETIVNNESGDIIRILNSKFNCLTGNTDDYYPEHLRAEIDAVNERVYHDVNNGVYKAGFATKQSVYEAEYDRVFAALDWLEARLVDNDYLVGNQLTEADWRLWTTLVRFDPVYHGHFKLNRRRLAEYPNLSGFVHRLMAVPGIAQTVHLDDIKQHYYGSHETINPTGIVPKGPEFI
jgi:putative glutathione S-transferase